MDEYQFQHEEDPALKKAATDAVNRTLWFQHWTRNKAAFRNQLLISAGILIVFALLNIIPLPADNVTIIMAPRAWFYVLMPVVMSFVAILVMAARGSDKWWCPERQNTVKRSDRFKIIWAFFSFSVLMIYLITHLFVQYFALILLLVGWDWYQLHKLKKNLITWGILEPDGSTRFYECVPSIARLEKSEQALGDVLASQIASPRPGQSQKPKTTV